MQEIYGDCGCDHDHKPITLASPGDDDIESLLNGFLKRIHDNTLSPGQVDPAYYKHVADQLKGGVAKGLGGIQFGASDYRNTLKAYLDQNIYAFSSARSLYMLQQYRSFLTDADGNLLSESAFIKKVSQISQVDNVTHLKIERTTAIASAQAAESWEGLKAFPAIEYRTTGGENVCPICGGLDGLVISIDDSILGTIYVPNHFGCMCKFVPAAGDYTLTDRDLIINRVKAANIPPLFKNNVGEQRFVFANDHPYIQKIGVDKLAELDAEKNYGLKSTEKIYDTATKLPSYEPLADKAVANAWWEDMAGSEHGNFTLKGADDIEITFDDTFRKHVLDENRDDRFRFLKELKEVVTNPDEIWTNRQRGFIHTTYIKYYNDFPIVLAVEARKDVRAITLYEAQKNGEINYKAMKNLRKGALKYRSH